MRNQLLRDCDWAGMAHGVEIRVPFVDVTVIRALAPMLAGPRPPTKAQLAKTIAHPLAATIAARTKTGFSVPVRDWLRAEIPARVARARPARLGARRRTTQGRAPVPVVRHRRVRRAWRHRALQPGSPRRRCAAFPPARGWPRSPGICRIHRRPMPRKLVYVDAAAGGKLRYLASRHPHAARTIAATTSWSAVTSISCRSPGWRAGIWACR